MVSCVKRSLDSSSCLLILSCPAWRKCSPATECLLPLASLSSCTECCCPPLPPALSAFRAVASSSRDEEMSWDGCRERPSISPRSTVAKTRSSSKLWSSSCLSALRVWRKRQETALSIPGNHLHIFLGQVNIIVGSYLKMIGIPGSEKCIETPTAILSQNSTRNLSSLTEKVMVGSPTKRGRCS